MLRLRLRYAQPQIQKLASFWPIVGVVGLRQVGKTTLLEQQHSFASQRSLDDESVRSDANASAKNFLASLSTPALIDEVQKAPKLFDALKLQVHRERRPGRYFLTGSVSFSEGAGIRESLTGRIGLCHLHPLTLGEAAQVKQPSAPAFQFKKGQAPRLSPEVFSAAMTRGGMPVPMFMRDEAQRNLYWNGWLSTTLLRDLPKLFKKGFDPEFAYQTLEQLGAALREGELPTLKHFKVRSKRKLKTYLAAFEAVFVLRRLPCHDLGTGTEAWLFSDAGLAGYMMKTLSGEGVSLSLARHVFLNEISALKQYGASQIFLPQYFKSQKGTPVDLVVDGVPIKIVPLSEAHRGPWGWHAKAALGAAKKLGAPMAVLAAPVNEVYREKDHWIVPWSIWS